MAKYRLLIKPSAAKEIEAINSKEDRQRVVRRIEALALTPRPAGCERLSSSEQYRVRQGPFRIVYAIEDEDARITVVKVGHRKDVYR